jgi:outer membrane protein TolC
LGQLLLIDPSVTLVPQVVEVVPIRIVDTSVPVGDLLAIASHNRQDLAASHEQIAAAWERVRKAKYGPLLPKLQVANQSGVFGGGINDEVDDFKGRNTVSALMYWELRNLGFGNRAEKCERQAGLDQAHFQRAEVQARMVAQIVESAEIALAKEKSLELAKEAVSEATELYRINRREPFNVVDAKNLFNALRPLQAIQILHQTQHNYLSAVIDYNRAQYRLHSYLGCPINDDTVDSSR